MLNYGIWDQIRVDHGREFYLMLFIQDHLKHLRYDTNKSAFVQTSSRMVNIYSIITCTKSFSLEVCISH
jgi:hypothetical protein